MWTVDNGWERDNGRRVASVCCAVPSSSGTRWSSGRAMMVQRPRRWPIIAPPLRYPHRIKQDLYTIQLTRTGFFSPWLELINHHLLLPIKRYANATSMAGQCPRRQANSTPALLGGRILRDADSVPRVGCPTVCFLTYKINYSRRLLHTFTCQQIFN